MPVNAAMGHYNRNIYYDNNNFKTQKKEREALHCRSLHFLRLLGIVALVVETSNAEAPRRYV